MRISTLFMLPPLVSSTLLSPRQYDIDSGGDDNIERLCFPTNSTGDYNLDAPCNKVFDLEATCLYGANYNWNNDDGDMPHASAEKQRDCICKSQFWDYVNGCSNCERLHGASPDDGWFPSDYIKSMSKVYCSSTQTLGIDDFLGNYTESTTLPASLETSMSDVIGNKTDVSLYWTSGTATSTTSASATATGSRSANEVGAAGAGSTGVPASSTAPTAGASATGAADAVGGDLRIPAACMLAVMGLAFLA